MADIVKRMDDPDPTPTATPRIWGSTKPPKGGIRLHILQALGLSACAVAYRKELMAAADKVISGILGGSAEAVRQQMMRAAELNSSSPKMEESGGGNEKSDTSIKVVDGSISINDADVISIVRGTGNEGAAAKLEADSGLVQDLKAAVQDYMNHEFNMKAHKVVGFISAGWPFSPSSGTVVPEGVGPRGGRVRAMDHEEDLYSCEVLPPNALPCQVERKSTAISSEHTEAFITGYRVNRCEALKEPQFRILFDQAHTIGYALSNMKAGMGEAMAALMATLPGMFQIIWGALDTIYKKQGGAGFSDVDFVNAGWWRGGSGDGFVHEGAGWQEYDSPTPYDYPEMFLAPQYDVIGYLPEEETYINDLVNPNVASGIGPLDTPAAHGEIKRESDDIGMPLGAYNLLGGDAKNVVSDIESKMLLGMIDTYFQDKFTKGGELGKINRGLNDRLFTVTGALAHVSGLLPLMNGSSLDFTSGSIGADGLCGQVSGTGLTAIGEWMLGSTGPIVKLQEQMESEKNLYFSGDAIGFVAQNKGLFKSSTFLGTDRVTGKDGGAAKRITSYSAPSNQAVTARLVAMLKPEYQSGDTSFVTKYAAKWCEELDKIEDMQRTAEMFKVMGPTMGTDPATGYPTEFFSLTPASVLALGLQDIGFLGDISENGTVMTTTEADSVWAQISAALGA